MTSLTFLPPELFFEGQSFGSLPGALALKFGHQQFARQSPIHPLLAGILAFYLDAGGAMPQKHTSRYLVHVLAAVAAGADERFLEVRFPNAESGNFLFQRV